MPQRGGQSLKSASFPRSQKSQLVGVDRANFLRLNAEVGQRLSLCGVPQGRHKSWNIHAKGDPLVIPPGFSQGMRPVVSRQIQGRAPGFDEPTEVGGRKRPPLSLEDRIAIGVHSTVQQAAQGRPGSAVEQNPTSFPGLGLADEASVRAIGQNRPGLSGGKPEQVRGSQGRIDSDHEQGRVSGMGRQQAFDGRDVG